MKSIILTIAAFGAVFVSLYALGLSFYQQVIIAVLSILGLILAFDKLLIIPVFVIVSVMLPIFSTEYNIIGILNINNFVTLLTILVLSYDRRRGIGDDSNREREVKLIERFLIGVLLLSIIQQTLFMIRDLYNSDISNLYRFIVKEGGKIFGTLLLVKGIHRDRYVQLTITGLFISSIIMSSSVVFSDFFMALGLSTSFGDAGYGELGTRYGGLHEAGVNHMGTYLAMLICFFLVYTIKGARTYWVKAFILMLAMYSFIALLMTMSRTAILGISISYLLFTFKSRGKLVNYLILPIVAYAGWMIIQSDLGQSVKVRVEYGIDQTGQGENRIDNWSRFIEYFDTNPEILMFGSKESVRNPITLLGAHNLYLQSVFDVGLILMLPILVFMFFPVYMINAIKLLRSRALSGLVFVPFFLATMMFHDLIYLRSFALISAVVCVLERKSES